MFEHLRTRSNKQALVHIKSLSRPVTLLHVTDSHMNVTDQREGITVLKDSIAQYSYDPIQTQLFFRQTLDYAESINVDSVVLTGDIVSGATLGNIEMLEKEIRSLSVPCKFTLGNHDWEYPGQPWCDEIRQKNAVKFEKIFGGSASVNAHEIEELLILTVDNSMYNVTERQLEFVQCELAKGRPTLLFMHIPIYIPTLLEDVLSHWHAPLMMASPGWDMQARRDQNIEDASQATLAFLELLTRNPYNNLIGIFCGHVHFAHQDKFGHGSYQYITQAGFLGGYRVIRLLPWL